jgi:[pyruvate, water dikinase]-phosphate phosphotransferase / [pyruvate, water dikinase] kinase
LFLVAASMTDLGSAWQFGADSTQAPAVERTPFKAAKASKPYRKIEPVLEPEPRRLKIFTVSDGGGATAEAVADAVTVQFPGVDFTIERFAGVRTREQVLSAVREAERHGGIIVHTIVMTEIRRLLLRECRQRGLDHVDLIGPLMGQVSQKVEMRPLLRPGVSRGLSDDYFQRIEAIQYTVQHDDGQGPEALSEADIVLVGVSRSSKTPLSVFLSMRGWKVANVPIVLGVDPPAALYEIDQRKIVGLTISQSELVQIRRHRVQYLGSDAGGNYDDPDKIAEELAYCRRIIRRGYPWPIVDITGKSIEESAKEVISWVESQRLAIDFVEELPPGT